MSLGTSSLNDLKIHRPSGPSRRTSTVAIVVGAVVVLLAGAATFWLYPRNRALPVRTALVQQSTSGGGAATLLNASGYVTARRAATVSSKVTGRVMEVMIEEGMRVNEGQMLARIDSTNVEANLRLAEAQLESSRKGIGETQAALDQAQRTLKRTTQLSENKVTSDSELDASRAEVATLQARLERQKAEVAVAERNLELWKQQLDDTIVRAPFAGVVTAKNAQPGEMISPMSAGGSFTRTGICTIVDMSSLEVEVDVNESYINRVSAGQPVVVTLDSYPEWHIPSKVIAIIPAADRQKATVRVRVGFDALDPRILPDMGLKVAFQSTETSGAQPKRVVTVPKSALRQLNGRDAVWVVVNGKVERRAISVGATQGDEMTVTAGLEPQERVVLDAPETLGEGARIIEKNP